MEDEKTYFFVWNQCNGVFCFETNVAKQMGSCFFLKDLSQGDYNSIGGVCVRRKHIFFRVTAAVTFCLAFYTSFI